MEKQKAGKNQMKKEQVKQCRGKCPSCNSSEVYVLGYLKVYNLHATIGQCVICGTQFREEYELTYKQTVWKGRKK